MQNILSDVSCLPPHRLSTLSLAKDLYRGMRNHSVARTTRRLLCIFGTKKIIFQRLRRAVCQAQRMVESQARTNKQNKSANPTKDPTKEFPSFLVLSFLVDQQTINIFGTAPL
eukprot:Gregarina_sp_Poly_1__546@NODE_1130_length_4995_cov_340_345373_g781_i0_p4_GENE_NODE_1130_length_4995_cov_340_345373_g781_i0NODE_1130_length_4995_cov_340_345373_g781_i0_p4_ORF_typecomplete_len113_score13_53DUF4576/PF15144_6/0_089_NODE_1130_length_4995_cov_340_345373_g781_i013241662